MPEVHEFNRKESSPAQRSGGYAEWLALGAIAAGSVGAIVGLAKCARSASKSHEPMTSRELEPETLTAPHGDKLRGAVV